MSGQTPPDLQGTRPSLRHHCLSILNLYLHDLAPQDSPLRNPSGEGLALTQVQLVACNRQSVNDSNEPATVHLPANDLGRFGLKLKVKSESVHHSVVFDLLRPRGL